MSVFSERVKRVRQIMAEKDIDYLVLAPSANMLYLTGLKTVADERFQAVLLPKDGKLTLILPEMYRDTVDGAPGNFALLTWSDHQDPLELIRKVVQKKDCRVAVDERMWAVHLLIILKAFSGADFVEAGKVMGEVRVLKEKNELDLMERSGRLVDRVMEDVVKEIKEGVTEKELSLFIENRIKALGADGIAFKPIIASGLNGALPHHNTGNRKLKEGDFVTLDFGAVLEGYCSDITRTFHLGRASEEDKEVYRAVREANEAAFNSVEEGVLCCDVDRTARAVIERAGYGKYFIHRTGHGIGLDYHEEPYIVEGNERPLRRGMAFSIEPGIYLPGKLGVRIEDIVAITEEGPRRFNNYPRDLIEI